MLRAASTGHEDDQEQDQRVIPHARMGFHEVCIKLEKPAADTDWVEACSSGGDSSTSTRLMEWNPHAPSIVWAMHKFFPGNYMGLIGLSVEEENLRAAPGTPAAARAEASIQYENNSNVLCQSTRAGLSDRQAAAKQRTGVI